MIKKWDKIYESGIKDINKIIQDHKNEGNLGFEIFFHMDLDGVTSAIAMKKYLESYGLKIVDSHIIQYGNIEFAIKNKKPNSLAVLVDFSHFRTTFTIGTDHHSGQTGEISGSSYAKPSKSNLEIISGEISNSDIFYPGDVDLIRTIDSADFFKYGITPDEIHKSIFKLDRTQPGQRSRFLMGFVVNRLLLAYKNKRISVKSFNGKNEHINKNLLECVVLDSSPSLYSIYINLQHYINSSVSLEWNFNLKSYTHPRKLTTPEEINNNLQNYIKTRLSETEIKWDPEYKIVKQYGIGNVFETGSYDRYVIFKNYPDSDFACTVFPMGLIQVSCNPFKESKIKNIDLGEITKELLNKYKYQFSNINISLTDIKRINESEIGKMISKFGDDYDAIGFSFEDLKNFYNNDIIFLPNRESGDMKTRAELNLSGNEYIELINKIKLYMSIPYSKWTVEIKSQMDWCKIPLLKIIENLSGGHKSITNIQGLNFLDCRKDLCERLFGNNSYTVIMRKLADGFIEILKQKIDGSNSDLSINNDIKLMGDINENFQYYIQKMNEEPNPVSKSEFIEWGYFSKKSKNKKLNIEIQDKKVIGKFNFRESGNSYI